MSKENQDGATWAVQGIVTNARTFPARPPAEGRRGMPAVHAVSIAYYGGQYTVRIPIDQLAELPNVGAHVRVSGEWREKDYKVYLNRPVLVVL